MAIATIIVIAIPVLIVLWVIMSYNGLVSWRNQVKNAWSQIDVQLKRRYDLIPNLVETVKGYAKHESGTLEAVIKARNSAMAATTPQQVGQAENVLQGTLKSLFALSENYPDLKANQNFLALQEELTSTENKISFARQFYNDTVNRFNTMIQSFPKNMLAGMFGFQAAQLFEVEAPEERKAVKVSFS
jgi:LemA protein